MALTPEEIEAKEIARQDLALQMKEQAAAADALEASLKSVTEGTDRYAQKQLESLNATLSAKEAALEHARAVGKTDGIEKATEAVRVANQKLEQNRAAAAAAAKAQKEYNAQVEAGTTAIKNLGGSIGLMGKDWEKSSVGMLATKGGLTGIKKGIEDMLTPMNLAGSLLAAFFDASMEVTMATDDASVAIARATGDLGTYDAQIIASEESLKRFGIGAAELGENIIRLRNELGTFTDMADKDQQTMNESIVMLEKFGISADQTVGNIASMTAAMGISGVEAVKLQQSLYLTAQENEISAGKMMSDFAAVSDELMAFGDTAVDVFADLSIAAKKSNMEVSELLGIATKFDTFEGATDSVGKLNALLGGPFLNSLEMVMETDPTKRLSMLSGALNSTGKSFQDMSYYERKAIADAAGLASTADLAKVMSGEFDGLAGNVGKSEEELAAMEETTGNFNTLMDEVKQTLMTFAMNFQPYVGMLKNALQFIQDIPKPIKDAMVMIAGSAIAFRLVKSFFDNTKASAEGVTEAMGGSGGGGAGGADGGGITGSMKSFTKSLGKLIAVGMGGLALFKVLTMLAKHLSVGMKGGEGMASMFESMGNVKAVTFGKAAMGIAKIAHEMNQLEDGKAIQISTVFDSAAAMASTQSLNTASAAGTAAGASSGQSVVTAPIQVTSVIQMNGREFGKAVAESEVTMKIANAAVGAGV